MSMFLTMEASAFLHQSVTFSIARMWGGAPGWGQFFLEGGPSSTNSLAHILVGAERSILLSPVVDNFKSACSLGDSAGEFLKRSITNAAGDAQLLELGRQFGVELILPIILSDARFSCKVKEFREKVMKLVTVLHV
ncbi:uncharacterized protein ACHE_21470A [Aspergillus chevalieri]|uniref:Uncharacterized protein n=1 Tax=Aspergillus chevalieri TaxID=182096 RepID=A0A7R7ZMC1_ASPCH|nr:uncharacterized protein ACHE_21470A [Aspergillus chevalieri]BCR86012.1 hypothetical protein ACHE_21470A [Aspergillus chevalieri]